MKSLVLAADAQSGAGAGVKSGWGDLHGMGVDPTTAETQVRGNLRELRLGVEPAFGTVTFT